MSVDVCVEMVTESSLKKNKQSVIRRWIGKRGVTNHNISGQIDHPNYRQKMKLITGEVYSLIDLFAI